ncbi:MAG: hypothetical protein LBN06_12915, partial [Prevotellaceae bacterium]|nr:hypothetical protein [Prevotellaceae bacterium]
LRGTSASTSSRTKSNPALVPTGATYIEFLVKSTIDNSMIKCKIYPGSNMTNDYNLRSNNHYTLNLYITSNSLEAGDYRGESYTP